MGSETGSIAVASMARVTLEEREKVLVESRAEWRQWLRDHHAQVQSIWLVSWKKGRGPYVPYEDRVQEALAFGWIDSLPRKLDGERTMLLMSPRRRGSRWSAINKAHVAALEAAGQMTPAGRAKVEQAQADGNWDALKPVDRLEVPEDLATALGAHPGARRGFDALAPSLRRGLLERLLDARRPATRQKRLLEIVAEATKPRRAQ